MIWLRSILFNLFFFTWTGILLFSLWILMPLSPSRFRAALRLWPWGVLFGLKWLVGITYEVRGRENLRSGAVVFAAKHQSVWETMLFLLLDGEVAYTMKTELLRIPFWGWYMKKAGNVALDRTGGAAALRRMIREAKSILEEGRSVVIFPEGTRVKPGEKGKYQAGIAALYAQTGVPVVPVALNSGLFWGRHWNFWNPCLPAWSGPPSWISLKGGLKVPQFACSRKAAARWTDCPNPLWKG